MSPKFKKESQKTKKLMPTIAARHEGVFVRLAALAKQVEAGAKKRPEGAVSPAMRVTAEDVLFECREFIRTMRRRELPVAAPTLEGLSVQLGQAMAGLVLYETEHTQWDPARKAFVWVVEGEVRLVKRLKAQVLALPGDDKRKNDAMRDKVRKRIDEKLTEAYLRGMRDGHQGITPEQLDPNTSELYAPFRRADRVG